MILDYREKNTNWKSTIIWQNNWRYIIWWSRRTRLICTKNSVNSLIFWPFKTSNIAHYTSKKGCKYREKNSSSGSQWGDFFSQVSSLFLDSTTKSENIYPEFWIFTNVLIHHNKYVGVNKTLEKKSHPIVCQPY